MDLVDIIYVVKTNLNMTQVRLHQIQNLKKNNGVEETGQIAKSKGNRETLGLHFKKCGGLLPLFACLLFRPPCLLY